MEDLSISEMDTETWPSPVRDEPDYDCGSETDCEVLEILPHEMVKTELGLKGKRRTVKSHTNLLKKMEETGVSEQLRKISVDPVELVKRALPSDQKSNLDRALKRRLPPTTVRPSPAKQLWENGDGPTPSKMQTTLPELWSPPRSAAHGSNKQLNGVSGVQTTPRGFQGAQTRGTSPEQHPDEAKEEEVDIATLIRTEEEVDITTLIRSEEKCKARAVPPLRVRRPEDVGEWWRAVQRTCPQDVKCSGKPSGRELTVQASSWSTHDLLEKRFSLEGCLLEETKASTVRKTLFQGEEQVRTEAGGGSNLQQTTRATPSTSTSGPVRSPRSPATETQRLKQARHGRPPSGPSPCKDLLSTVQALRRELWNARRGMLYRLTEISKRLIDVQTILQKSTPHKSSIQEFARGNAS